MSPSLTMYYENFSLAAIANSIGIRADAMGERLKRERKKLGLKPRVSYERLSVDTRDFIEDKDLVLQLLESGMSVTEIGEKYDVCRRTVAKNIANWGWVTRRNLGEDMESWNITELYKGWSEAPDELIITVNKQPEFKLVRIKR